VRAGRAIACVVVAACGFRPRPGASTDDAPTSASCDPWLDRAWTARRALAIHAASVTGANADVPVAVVIANDADLAARARSDAGDVRFVDADGTTPLASEIERYDAATGTLVAWVRVPMLAHAAPDHALFLYYGRADPAPSAGSVWQSYSGVWHFSDGHDSSGAGHDAAGTVATAPGVLGSAVVCDGATNALDIASFARPSTLSYEAWVNTNVTDAGVYHAVITDWTADNRWFGSWGDELDFYDGGTNDHFFMAHLVIGAWTHIAATYDGTTLVVYTNGAPLGSFATSYAPVTSPLQLGYNPNNAAVNHERWNGRLDELRVSTVARSPEYIATSYANQLDPSGFVTAGALAHCP
jgi:biopolymer transport protein ExbB